MLNLRHKIQVKNGKADFFNLPLFKRELAQYEGKEAFLIIKPYKDKRSDNQNRYYWGVVMKILGEHLGYFPEEIHEAMRTKFLNTKEVEIGDKKYVIADSSSKLNTLEFEDYMSKIRTWASQELKLVIPLPNEADYEE